LYLIDINICPLSKKEEDLARNQLHICKELYPSLFEEGISGLLPLVARGTVLPPSTKEVQNNTASHSEMSMTFSQTTRHKA
jgi:hypothetical protein